MQSITSGEHIQHCPRLHRAGSSTIQLTPYRQNTILPRTIYRGWPSGGPRLQAQRPADLIISCGTRLLGADKVLEATPTLGGEDLSFFGHAGIPASFAFLGVGNDAVGAVHVLHTPQARTKTGIVAEWASASGSAAGPSSSAGAASRSLVVRSGGEWVGTKSATASGSAEDTNSDGSKVSRVMVVPGRAWSGSETASGAPARLVAACSRRRRWICRLC